MAKKFDLNGTWRLHQDGEHRTLKATVPGCVHTDLLAAGDIPDPFLRDNEAQVQWISRSAWIYEREFTLPSHNPEQITFLRCEGLDTLATVTLNGEEVGKADNMHRTWEFDVSKILREGENTLSIRFDPVYDYVQARAEKTAHARLRRTGRNARSRLDPQDGLQLRVGLGPGPHHLRHLALHLAGHRGLRDRPPLQTSASGSVRTRSGGRWRHRAWLRRRRALPHSAAALSSLLARLAPQGRQVAERGPRRRTRRREGRAQARLLARAQPAALVARRPRRAAALRGDRRAARRHRRAGRLDSAVPPRRPPHPAPRPAVPTNGARSFALRRQRRALLRQGRQLDPRRRSWWRASPASSTPASSRPPPCRQHEHAARPGRRRLRARLLLRPLRRVRHLRLAGLHVPRRRLSRRRRRLAWRRPCASGPIQNVRRLRHHPCLAALGAAATNSSPGMSAPNGTGGWARRSTRPSSTELLPESVARPKTPTATAGPPRPTTPLRRPADRREGRRSRAAATPACRASSGMA
jgi:hypothetical protein